MKNRRPSYRRAVYLLALHDDDDWARMNRRPTLPAEIVRRLFDIPLTKLRDDVSRQRDAIASRSMADLGLRWNRHTKRYEEV